MIRSGKPAQEFVTTFLSCSVRACDRALVDAIEKKVLTPRGFRCLTIGRNVSLPSQPDDAIRNIMESVDCLVGVATVRLEAADTTNPNQSLRLASPYILQETAMAHQRGLPFLLLKTPDVTLQGVTAKNLYIEVLQDMPNGKPVFRCSREMLISSLDGLKTKALEARKRRSQAQLLRAAEKLSALAVGAVVVSSVLDALGRPECFGNFYYRDSECQLCSYKHDCKVAKARGAS